MQNGGERKQLHKALTGEYAFGLQNEEEANAELETKEYIKDSQGIRKVEGKTHEQGGEMMNLEDGTRVLSDHLKVGSSYAKELNKMFDLGVKSSDTYAKVLDRYDKKSGLKKINEELEKYIAQLDKQQKETEDETTLGLNTQYLTEKINEKFKEKEPLEKQREGLFDVVFSMQESAKEQEEQKKQFQTGGTMTYNGDTVIGLAKKYNIDPDKAKELVTKFRDGKPMYQDAGIFYDPKIFQNLNPTIGAQPNTSGMSDAQFYQGKAQERSVANVTGSARNYTPEEKEAIKKHYAKFVKDKESLKNLEKAVDDNKLVFNEGMLNSIKSGDLIPIELQHEGKGTFGKQTEDKINNYVYRDTFKQLTGKEFDPTNREHTKQIYNTVIPALKEKGVTYHGAPFNNLNVDAFGNIVASEPGFVEETAAKKAGNIDLDKFRKATAGQKQLIADEYGVTVDAIENTAKNPTNKFLKLSPQGQQSSTGVVAPELDESIVVEDEITTTPVAVENERRRRLGLMLLPDQTPLPPSSQMEHLKANRRYDRKFTSFMSPENALQEIGRQQLATQTQINMLPDQAAASVFSTLTANTADASNKAIGEVNRYNAQAQERADDANIQIQGREEDAAWQDALNYEQRTFLAKDKTEQDWRNYYNRLNENQLNNWKHIEMTNRYNAMNPDIQFTGTGYEIYEPDFKNDARVNRMIQDSNSPVENLPAKKKKPSAKKGGRFKK
jgi:hypothetical protein